MNVSDSTRSYYEEVAAVARGIDQDAVDQMIDILSTCAKAAGCSFCAGAGGARRLCHNISQDLRIEAYAPTDNVPS